MTKSWGKLGLSSLLSLTLLSGCSLFSGEEDDVLQPKKLQSFDESVELEKLWSRSVGDGADGQFVRLSPALYKDTVFAGDVNGEVAAVDAETGDLKWEVELDLPVSGGVSARYGMVLLGTNKGTVVALSSEDGSELWRKQVSSEVLSAPVTNGSVVIVRTIDEKVTALDAKTGERRWIFENSQPVLSLRGTATPLINKELVYIGFGNGTMKALNVRTGSLVWEQVVSVPEGRTELERMVDVDGSPTLDGETLYVVNYQGNIVAMNARNGALLWQREASSYEGLASGFGQLYMVDDKSYLSAVEKSNNAILWQQKDLENRRLNTPQVLSSYVVVADYDGYVHLFSQVDGKLVGRFRADSDGVRGPMIERRGVLYIYGNGGKLMALKIES